MEVIFPLKGLYSEWHLFIFLESFLQNFGGVYEDGSFLSPYCGVHISKRGWPPLRIIGTGR